MFGGRRSVAARRVVIATGLANQQFRARGFRRSRRPRWSRTPANTTIWPTFRGKRVAVVGRGQSACESAALLAEAGAEPVLICRGPIRWFGAGAPAVSGG